MATPKQPIKSEIEDSLFFLDSQILTNLIINSIIIIGNFFLNIQYTITINFGYVRFLKIPV